MTIIKFLPLGNQKFHRNCINSHDWQLHLTVARQLKCLFICSWSVALSSCGRDLVNKTSPSLFCGATELSALAWISVAGGDITLTLCPAWAHSRCLSHRNCHEISVLFSWWSFPPQDRRCLLLSLVRQRWWGYQGLPMKEGDLQGSMSRSLDCFFGMTRFRSSSTLKGDS